MPILTVAANAAPLTMLKELRRARVAGHDQLSDVEQTWGLVPLTGGRNNAVYRWTDSQGVAVCVKEYKLDDRRRSEREWEALTALHEHGADYAPTPLWFVDDPEHSVIGMTLLVDTPLLQARDRSFALQGLVSTTRAIQKVPPRGILATLPRIDDANRYGSRLVNEWPSQLDQCDDPLVPTMRGLLAAWHDRGDAQLLAEPTVQVLSRGDANLLNWLVGDAGASCFDFEFAGLSDAAFDAADHIEHISAREVADDLWHELESDLGIDDTNRRRFEAARRTCGLRWLAVLWKQRHKRAEEFVTQLERVQMLFG